MNAAAKAVMTELPDITIAYGISDEYRCDAFLETRCFVELNISSFVLHKTCTLFERRARYPESVLSHHKGLGS